MYTYICIYIYVYIRLSVYTFMYCLFHVLSISNDTHKLCAGYVESTSIHRAATLPLLSCRPY